MAEKRETPMKALLAPVLLSMGLSACSPWIWAQNAVTSAVELVGAASRSSTEDPAPKDGADECGDITVVTSQEGEIVTAFPPKPGCY